jgi:hypothetical protein
MLERDADTGINLTDPDLFGNEAGEDEDPRVLQSYFLNKPEFARFSEPQNRLAIVRARKGMGKSALLSKLSADLRQDRRNVLAVIKGSDLAAFGLMSTTMPNVLINEWQQRICVMLVYELGKALKIAFSDTAMALVESSELAGFKSKNIVGSLLDRIKIKIGDAELQKPEHRDSFQLLKRHLSNGEINAWVMIDDIDATFVNSAESSLQISTFFSACRRLTTDVTNLAIRASVRSDVWTVVKRTDEALDKCEQYIFDISWSNDEARRILENKIHAYVRRKHTLPRWVRNTPRERSLGLIFKPKVPWGDNEVPAENADRNRLNRIGIKQITGVLRNFGGYRLDDLYREHGHQYPQLQKLIEAFSSGPSRYSTNQLLEHISKRIIKPFGLPEVDGESIHNGAFGLARFLFKIGFIHGRDDQESSPSFVRFEDRSDLLSTTVNPDDGMIWEIHPSYRQVLRISNSGE